MIWRFSASGTSRYIESSTAEEISQPPGLIRPRPCRSNALLKLHFFVPNHGPKFIALMDEHMPHWRQVRKRLNESPLSHIDWEY